jgi:hypothetical protein
MFFSSWGVVGQNPADDVPSYDFKNSVEWGSVTASENSNLTIAIDTDSKGNLYRLTFGSGIIKSNSEGGDAEIFISDTQFDAPLDFAIDSNDNFYVIDYEDQEPYTDNGKIRIFNSEGVPLPGKTIYTSYFRPLGITLDFEDNAYVSLYNEGGTESTISSEIRIYDNNGILISNPPFKGTTNHPLEIPYRLAVDTAKNLYVSHGDNGGEVLVFNSNFQYLETLNDRVLDGKSLGVPGGIVIDDYGYIHIIDYVNYVDFVKILNYQNLSDAESISLALGIFSGVSAQAFNVKIFNPERELVQSFYDYQDDKIKLPIDIAFGFCTSQMFINNTNPMIRFPLENSGLDFNLLKYLRTPSFDNETPVIDCPDDIVIEVDEGENYATVIFPDATATDNCSVTVAQTDGDLSESQFPVGEHTLEFTATDDAGNVSTCTFKIKVILAADVDDAVFQNCLPDDITDYTESGQCFATVTFPTPTASDSNGTVVVVQTGGLESEEEFPVGDTEIVFEATGSNGNTVRCSFKVTIIDYTGSCEEPEEPEETFQHIFIYPNPTPGPFTFDTPNGWSIEKVEVYDMRGRYVLTETYSENEFEYSMDLSSLQQAVYILKLYTSKGIKIIRVIIY